jgi:hypothetical protein
MSAARSMHLGGVMAAPTQTRRPPAPPARTPLAQRIIQALFPMPARPVPVRAPLPPTAPRR